MADRRDWYFLQQVTEAEMDERDVVQDLEYARFLMRTFGATDHVSASIPGSEINKRQMAGSIISGGEIAPTSPGASKFVAVRHLTCAIQTEEDADADFSHLLMDDDVLEPAAMIGRFGNPRVGSSEAPDTYDFTADIAGIGGGNEANFRVYAVLKRVESDPRIDGNGAPVNFKRAMAMEIQVDKDEGASPHSGLPAIRTGVDEVHLGVVGALDSATTMILAADIAVQDRRYGGWSPFCDLNGLTKTFWSEDSFAVAIGVSGERVTQVTHGLGYTTITPFPGADQTVSSRRRIFGYSAHDGGGGATAKTFGLFRHRIEIEQVIDVQDASGDPVSDVNIIRCGATKAAEAIGLEADDISYRYQFDNQSGVAVDIVTFNIMRVYNNLGQHFQAAQIS